MSRSPERISSYRRHFEDTTSSSYQVRVSSPSPVRREAGRCRSASYTRTGATRASSSMAVGSRTLSSTRRPLMTSGGAGAVCVRAGGAVVDLDAVAAENQEFISTRTGERKEMVALNDRLAAYIEKVRSLEQQNKLLEAEIEALQNRFLKPTGLRMLYEEQLKDLRKLADQMRMQRDLAAAAKEAVAGQLVMMKMKYEEALELRKKAELDIEAFRPDVDAATSARIALEKQLDNLEVEIEFLQRVHKEEIEELMKQMYSAHASVQDAYSLPDLSAAVQQVQLQYEDIASKNIQEMDSWYRNKFDDLNNKSTRHVDSVRSVRQEIAGAKKDIQGKERDMEALKTKNEALEAQLRETQEKHRKELEALQARIEALQLELKSTKEKIALHLREYQDLLNIKMSLEIEITTYRKLIEGEDSRLSSMVGMQTRSLMGASTVGAFSTGAALGAGGGIAGGFGAGAGGLGGAISSGAALGATSGIAGGLGAGAAGRDGSTLGAKGGIAGGPGAGVGGLGAGVGGLGAGAGGLGAGAVSDGTTLGAKGGIAGGPGAGAVGPGAGGPGAGAGGPGAGAGGLGGVVSDGSALGAKGGIAGGPGAGGPGAGAGGLGGGISDGTGLGAKGGIAGGPGAGGPGAGGLGGVVSDGTGLGAKGGISGGPGAGVGGPGAGGLGGAISDGTALGAKGGIAGGPGAGVTGLGGAISNGTALGVKGGIAGGPGAGVIGLGGGMGLGAKCGIAGALGAGLGGAFGSGTTINYSEEQAVEMTERKTVLIRTVKADDETVQSDMQERTYSISGAAQEEEEE